MALRGPNGSGKTTILRCVAGSLTPTAGRVYIDGEPSGSLAARKAIGVSLSQERSFYSRLTGVQNLEFFGRLRGKPKSVVAREVRTIIEELEIQQITPLRVASCSSGMLQQLAIARALLGAPRLLLLDEPTRSLDERASARFWSAIDRRKEAGVLIATHKEEDLKSCQVVIDLET